MTEEEQPQRGKLETYLREHWGGLVIICTPIMFSPIILFNDGKAFKCMYTLLIMSVYWISEIVPLGITSMIPMFMFPIFDIMSTERICLLYFTNSFIMFIISIMVAAAVEFSELHIRIALKVMQILGCSPMRLHLSICIVSVVLSMWITNSAATALMCPIISAILDQLETEKIVKAYHPKDYGLPKKERRPSRLGLCFFLGAAYSSSIGGVGTLIGTPTNLVYKSIYEGRFPTSTSSIEFGKHMLYAVPIAVACTFTVFIVMEIIYVGLFRPNSPEAKEANIGKEGEKVGQKIVDEKYRVLGPMTIHEKTTAVLFGVLVIAYVSKDPGFIDGWDKLFECDVKTASPTVLILLAMFIMPIDYSFIKYWLPESLQETRTCLDWEFVTPRLPWNLGFVIGSGASLAEGIKISGMASLLGDWLAGMSYFPPSIILLFCIALATLLTNLSANVASCNVIIPVLAEISVTCKIHPLYLILPVGTSCSFAFLLPVGTPPNAIVQAHANIPSSSMLKGGIPPSITAAITLWATSQTYGTLIYHDLHEFPSWASE